MNFLHKTLRKYIPEMMLIILLSAGQVIAQLAVTGSVSSLVKYAMEGLEKHAEMELIRKELLAGSLKMAGVAAASGLMTIVNAWFCSKISSRIAYDMRDFVFKKIMKFSLQEADKISVARMLSITTHDIRVIQDVVYMFSLAGVPTLMYSVLGYACVKKYHTGMEWIVCTVILMSVLLTVAVFRKVIYHAKSVDAGTDRFNMVFRQSLTGLLVIRAFGMEQWNEKLNRKAGEDLRDASLNMYRNLQVFQPLVNFIMNITTVAVMWSGVYKVSTGILEVGILIAFTSYVQIIISSFVGFAQCLLNVPRMRNASVRIKELVGTDVQITDGTAQWPGDARIETVEFCDVSFSYYPKGGNVLDHISFAAQRGKTTAIIGDTGSGKSTILKLILRMYDVRSGTVKINGMDIRELKMEDIRERTGYVPQNNFLFSGSIASNISLEEEKTDEKEIIEAARAAEAEDFILRKPEKYSAPVSRGGMNLSGGQRQRIAIARAIVKEHDVFLFDDSFSALDMKTDAQIRKSLKEKNKDALTIVVAQRVSTVRDADQIIVLHNGTIAGKGTHEELMRSCGLYREIADSQLTEDDRD